MPFATSAPEAVSAFCVHAPTDASPEGVVVKKGIVSPVAPNPLLAAWTLVLAMNMAAIAVA